MNINKKINAVHKRIDNKYIKLDLIEKQINKLLIKYNKLAGKNIYKKGMFRK